MAIYHHSTQVIARSAGKSATAAAGYRAGINIVDERIGQTFDYSRKNGVYYSKILVPSSAENLQWAQDRAQLWNKVEASEKRVDAQLAREVNVALPIELSHDQKIALIEEYVRDNYTSIGMIADINVHDIDTHNPHAHIMLTMRDIVDGNFGQKNRGWNNKQLLITQRENWAKICNRYLEEAGIEAKIDHRSNEARGIKNIPQIHLGPNVAAMKIKGIETDRGDIYDSIIAANQEIEQCQQKIEQINEDIGLLAFSIFQQKRQDEEKKRQEQEKQRQDEEQKRQELENKKRQEEERKISWDNNPQVNKSDDLKYADGLYYALCPEYGKNRFKSIEIGDCTGIQTELASGNIHHQLKRKNDVILDFIVDEKHHTIDIIRCEIREEDAIAEELLLQASMKINYFKWQPLRRTNLANDRAEILSQKPVVSNNETKVKPKSTPPQNITKNLDNQNKLGSIKKQQEKLNTPENIAWIGNTAFYFLWSQNALEYRGEKYYLATDQQNKSISIVQIEDNQTVIDLVCSGTEWNSRREPNISQKNIDDFKKVEKYLQELQFKNQNQSSSSSTPSIKRGRR